MDYALLGSIIISIIPSLILGYYIYNMDKVEKEPKGLLTKLFVGGILALLLTLLISDDLKLLLPNLMNADSKSIGVLFFYNFIGVALLEELCKWFFLGVCSWRDKNFNFLFDGIVYSAFVALGFATLENVLYSIAYSGELTVLLLRAVLSVPAHLFFGIYMGYFYGKAKMLKYNKKRYIPTLLLSLLVPFILHGFFDFCLSMEHKIYTIIYIIFMIVLYIISLKRVSKVSLNDKYLK